MLLAFILPLVFLIRPGKTSRRAALCLLLAGLAFITTAAISIFFNADEFYLNLYNLTPDFVFDIYLDRLSSFFIALVGIVSFCIIIFSFRYIEHSGTEKIRQLSPPLLSIFILSMIMVVVSANMFGFIFFWEVMSVSSFLLIMLRKERAEARKAGIFYFVMTQVSTLFLLTAFLLIYRYTGSLGMQATNALPQLAKSFAFITLFIGFGTKAGIIPFHKWLPYADSAAPSNIAALMSGVTLKIAIYGLCRFAFNVLEPDLWWGFVLLIFGTISAVLGVIYALKEHDFKKLLAYHSIENIGIIVTGLGLYVIFSHYGLETQANLSLVGALFHALNHAIFKSLLFMTAGSVIQATGTRNIEEMGGLVKTMPVTAFLFLIGSCAISALPPLNGFASEVMIFQAYLGSFELNNPLLEIVMVAGLAAFALMSALAAACFVKAFGLVFLARPRSKAAENATEAHLSMLAGPSILALLCVILGVFSYQIIGNSVCELPIPNMLPISVILLIITLFFIGLLKLSHTPVRISETWGCGINKQTGKMEYTASGFSEPIVTIFRFIYRTKKTNVKEYYDKDKSITKSTEGNITTLKFFEERIYRPLANLFMRLSRAVSRMYNKDIETILLYAFITIVILLITAGWWL